MIQSLHATVGVTTLQAGWARMGAGFGLVESLRFEFEKADTIHIESLLELVTSWRRNGRDRGGALCAGWRKEW